MGHPVVGVFCISSKRNTPPQEPRWLVRSGVVVKLIYVLESVFNYILCYRILELIFISNKLSVF